MKTLPKIKELKKKLSKKIKFTKFYKKLFNKIQIQDQHIKSFISINQKTNFHKNTSLPLQNIPIAIKDLVHLKGLKCTSGSLVFKDRLSTKNAKIVNRLLRAGSQIIGKNNQVEFAYGSWGTNKFYGTTVNPLDSKIDRVCGGSSSGSAASVAAGFAAASIGTDTGGSIRVPAAYCGLLGLKTSRGRIPLDGVELLSKEFDTIGIFANYIDDIDDVFKVISDQYKSKKFNRGLIKDLDLDVNLAYGRLSYSKNVVIGESSIECNGGINLIDEYPLLNFACSINSNDKQKLLKFFLVNYKKKNEQFNLNINGTLNILNQKINFQNILANGNYDASEEDLRYFKNTFENILFDKDYLNILNLEKIKKFILEVS